MASRRTKRSSLPTAARGELCIAGGALLTLAFPPFDQAWAAWIGLVPWLVAVRDLDGRRALRWSYLAGFVFFLGSISWLTHVTVFGYVLLCAIMALYFAAFGWTA